MLEQLTQNTISDVITIETSGFTDHRGGFIRLFCENKLKQYIGDRHIVQINHSKTNCVGAIRGMHFQHPPYAEMKLIRCISGRVLDVVIDLRAGSKTFLKWHAEELSKNNGRMLIVPEGFAHGFQILEEESELLYLHTQFYTPTSEDGLRYNDPLINITWPLPVTDLSERDCNHKLLSAEFTGIHL